MSSRTENFIEMLIVVVAVVIFIPSFAPAAPKSVVKKWTAVLPPLQYDYPFQGELTIIRGNLAVMNAVCLEKKEKQFSIPYACAISYRKPTAGPTDPADSCHVFIAEPDLLRGWVYADVLRHELGHCNGWVGHDGGRRPPAPSRNPPFIIRWTTETGLEFQMAPLPDRGKR